MLRWGQPYSPYDDEFQHDLYNEGYIGLPRAEFLNQDVLVNGFGQNVTVEDFDVYKKLSGGGIDIDDGEYTYSDLVDLGLVLGGRFGDNAMGTNLYP